MELFLLILKISFGVFFCSAGIMHLIKPSIFKNFIPDFLPKKRVSDSAGFIEFILVLGLIFTSTEKKAALGIFILMIFFLPIHLWDVTKIRPAIASKKVAIIRIPLQFILMSLFYLQKLIN